MKKPINLQWLRGLFVMRPRNGVIWGGLLGMLIGLVLLSDVGSAVLFGLLVGGFLGGDIAWAICTIRKTNAVSREAVRKFADKDARK